MKFLQHDRRRSVAETATRSDSPNGFARKSRGHVAAAIEQRGIPFESEVALPVHYKGAKLPVCYRIDFICMRDIVVEIKALGAISDREVAQVINYLKAAKIRRGLLLNFV